MTEINHSEEIGKEVARLFKEAHQIEPLAAECIFYGSTRSEENKRDQLKDIISGEYGRKTKAINASDKLAGYLSQLGMLGDLLQAANEQLEDSTPSKVGLLIWQLAEDAKEAHAILGDRRRLLEQGGAS